MDGDEEASEPPMKLSAGELARVAGTCAASAAIASAASSPICVLHTRIQLANTSRHGMGASALNILRSSHAREGWRTHFRGLGASACASSAFWMLYIPCFIAMDPRASGDVGLGAATSSASDVGAATSSASDVGLGTAAAATAAAAAANLATNPLWVARARMRTQLFRSAAVPQPAGPGFSTLSASMRSLVAEGGARALMRGAGAAQLASLHPALHLLAYEHLTKRRRGGGLDAGALGRAAAVGAVAKTAASALTYPLELARSRLFDSTSRAPRRALGEMAHVARAHGVGALYRGFWANAARAAVHSAAFFVAYEALQSARA